MSQPIIKTAARVAGLLGWRAESNPGVEWGARLVDPDSSLVLWISRDDSKARVSLDSRGGDNGRVGKARSDAAYGLSFKLGKTPSIGVTESRGGAAIARAITNRLLPKARPYWDAIVEAADDAMSWEDSREQDLKIWAERSRYGEFRENGPCVYLNSVCYGKVTAGDKFSIDLSNVPKGLALRIADLIADWRPE